MNKFKYLIVVWFALMPSLLFAAPKFSSYSQLEQPYPQQVYWGDTHVHTSLSVDANGMGNKSLTPRDAFRFARGEAITASSGMRARLDRPLDFLVVADHAEYLGFMPKLRVGAEEIMATEERASWSRRIRSEGATSQEAVAEILLSFLPGEELYDNDALRHSTWEVIVSDAEAANEPGSFTALAGFEWTSTPDDNNLHRVVIFRDGSDKTQQITPFSNVDSENPEDLWKFLEQYQNKTGGSVMAIPHNSNISNGLMFTPTQYDGSPIDRAYAERRLRWEPVVEVTQIKGDSEAPPFLSPNDEFADYGTWDGGNFNSAAARIGKLRLSADPIAMPGSGLKNLSMLKYEYVRSALRIGLEVAEQTGSERKAAGSGKYR